VTHVREVLAQALVRQPEPVEWDEAAEEAAAAARALASSAPAPTTH
jgi:ATP-dependent Lon protease